MPALIGWLVTAFSSSLATIFGDNLLRYIAGKAILTTLFIVILPLVLNNFLYDIIDMCMTLVNSNSTLPFDGNMNFSGLTAHFLSLLRVPECMSVLVSGLVLRATLNLIPFVRV